MKNITNSSGARTAETRASLTILGAVLLVPLLLGAKGCEVGSLGAAGEACSLQSADCGKGEFCSFSLKDSCGAADASGTCEKKPEACDDALVPVCGCDDKTYSNACEAHAAGVSVAQKGECDGVESSCGGLQGLACSAGEFCSYPKDAQCGAADQTGTCRAIPEVCSEEYSPVCGCDDKTYSNECGAHAAGVSVAREGECDGAEAICGGLQGLECSAGEFCSYSKDAQCGAADQTGSCRAMPEVCTQEHAPVCGCDGKTYSNECIANAAGVSVADQGECGGSSTGCGKDAVQCGVGEYCQSLSGCDTQLDGVCQTARVDCDLVYAPVCGCDGKTYENACAAQGAAMNVASDGACEEPTPVACGDNYPSCGRDEFCDFPPVYACGADSKPGTCSPIPSACTKELAPVCGCDGQTYDNACLAQAAAVSVQSEGACKPPPATCGGLLGLACGDGEFCSFSIQAQCGAGDQTGTCQPMPDACIQLDAPVCGCDGKTYSNECIANSAGTSVIQNGECGSTTCGPKGEVCAADEYCHSPTSDCATDDDGYCMLVPDACLTYVATVCGCDGVTYGNSCEASAVGVNIRGIEACN